MTEEWPDVHTDSCAEVTSVGGPCTCGARAYVGAPPSVKQAARDLLHQLAEERRTAAEERREADLQMEDMKRLAVGLIPFAKEIADFARDRLPEGTHFAVFVLPPVPLRPAPGETVPQYPVVGISSDRDVVAPQIGFWVMNVLEGEPG